MCILSCPIYKNQNSIHDTIHVWQLWENVFNYMSKSLLEWWCFPNGTVSSELSDCAQIDGAKKRPISATINATVTCGVMVWFPSRGYSYSALNPFPFLSLSRSRSRHKSFYFSSFCSLPLCKQSYLTFFLLIDIWYNLSLLLLKFYL